jgi:hypothetical protein
MDLFNEDEIIRTTDTSYIPESIRIKPTKEKQVKTKQPEVSPAVKAMTEKVVGQVENMLKALKAKYVIVLADGTVVEHGDLKFKAPKVSKPGIRNRTHPHQFFANYYKPYLQQMNVGDIQSVPVKDFDKQELQSAMTAWMSINWGSQSYSTQYDIKTDSIVVFRYK